MRPTRVVAAEKPEEPMLGRCRQPVGHRDAEPAKPRRSDGDQQRLGGLAPCG
jgi:hypothetical protein